MRGRFWLDQRSILPAGGVRVRDKLSDAEAVIYERGGRLCAMGFHGKATKADWRFSFRDTTSREAHVRKHFEDRRQWMKYRADQRQAEATRRAKGHGLQVGHILRTSWGYDQTNVEFFQIVELVGSCSVKVCEVASNNIEDTGWASGRSIPAIDQFKGEPMLRRVSGSRSVRIDECRRGYLWDGRPASWSGGH